MRWNFANSVIHGWSWEELDEDGSVVAESASTFNSCDEARDDAQSHGYEASRSEFARGLGPQSRQQPARASMTTENTDGGLRL